MRDIPTRVLELFSLTAARHSIFVVAVILVLVFAALDAAGGVEQELGMNSFFDPGHPAIRDFVNFNKDFGGEPIFIMVKSSDVTEPSVMEYMRGLSERLRGLDYVESVSSPTDSEVEVGSPLVPRQDSAVIVVQVKHVSQPEILAEDLDATIRFHPVPPDVEVVPAGGPMIDLDMERSMEDSRVRMLLAAVGLMVGILYLFFKTMVRGRVMPLLPLVAVTVAVAWTFGSMAILDIPMSMITSGFFPVLIGLGIDYGIQIQNRYEEERRGGADVDEAIDVAVTRTGRAIGIALVTTILGFSGLIFSGVPSLSHFGKTVVIGLIFSLISATWLLPALLKIMDRAEVVSSEREHFFDTSLERFAAVSSSHPVVILAVVGLVAVGGVYGSSKVEMLTDYDKYFPEDLPSFQVMDDLQELMGGTETINVVVKGADITSPEAIMEIDSLGRYLVREPLVNGVDSLPETMRIANGGELPPSWQMDAYMDQLPTERYVAGDTVSVINLQIEQLYGDELSGLIESLERDVRFFDPTFDVTITGMPVLGNHLITIMSEGQYRMTSLSFIAIFVATILIFKSPTKAAVPLIPILAVVAMTGGLMYVIGIPQTIISISMSSIILGLGVDYSIHIIHRYDEERLRGRSPEEALSEATRHIGKAIITSGLTTSGGFAAMVLSPMPIMQWFGTTAFLSIILSIGVTLLLLPPLLILHERLQVRFRNHVSAVS